MQTTNSKSIQLILLLFTFFVNTSVYAEDKMIFGPQLNNPYSTANMKLAHQELILQNGSSLFESSDIATNYLYVKILPATEDDLEDLKELDIEFYDYPLDRELSNSGTFYQDPSFGEGNPITYQYCVIPVNYVLPNMSTTILDSLFIPEYYIEENNLLTDPYEFEVYDLVYKSLQLTNNQIPIEPPSNGSRASKWTPSGNVTAKDDVIGGAVPIEGAKVRMRFWFITRVDYTDASGNFTSSHDTRFASNYSIKWDNKEYDIRNSWGMQEYVKGPRHTGAWNVYISSNKSLMHATIHRAAYRYHYQNIGGLKRPGVLRRVKINYYHKSGSSVNWGNFFVGVIGPIIPNIKIYGMRSGIIHKTNMLYSVTIHELAHASHLDLLHNAANSVVQVDGTIRESWANAVEWYITKIEYNSLGKADYGNAQKNSSYNDVEQDHMQKWPTNPTGGISQYTPMFIDAVDDYNNDIDRSGTIIHTCPLGGWYDGAHCCLGAPPSGRTAFVFQGNLYYSGDGSTSSCPSLGAYYDGANCFVKTIPSGTNGFVFQNSLYYTSTLTTQHYLGTKPFDEIKGYTLPQIESNWLKDIHKSDDLKNKLKQNKPAGMTDAIIDTYFNFY